MAAKTVNDKQDVGNVRLVIADDHAIMRAGLRQLIETNPSYTVVGEAFDGHQAVMLAEQHRPQVVIMDLGMPKLHGIEATRQIMQKRSNIAVIALSTYVDSRSVTEFFKAGGRGYVSKECLFDELAQAIRSVLDARIYVTPMVTDALLPHMVGANDASGDSGVFSVLTPREREILQLLAEGMTMKEVAAHLHLSYKTVHTFRRRLSDKLGLHTDAALTKYAIREHLTTLDY